ncbi:GNAT family N-acetyltransferase [uncultured Pseudomonas sp.]|uniref:GNAT family N-acetyltransferase n=1 Tax=uncultured Pseudomonas sp. TaxID=114707 RepID=UPI0025F1BF8F|nr:GNAT family N-acetyltransferase [uncultured Pseudomonas sp.]
MNFPPRIALADFDLVWPQPRLAAAFAEALNWSYAEHRRFLAWAREQTTVAQARDSLLAARGAFTLAQGEKRYFLMRGEELLGCLGLTPLEGGRRYEIGYWMHSLHTGQGFMTAALRHFVEQRGAAGFYLTTSAANTPSQRLAERVGFRRVRIVQDDRESPKGGRCATWVYELPPDTPQ